MIKFRMMVGVGMLALASAAAAGAQRNDFAACDGYGTPNGEGDGMTREATNLFGLIRTLGSGGNTRRTTPELGPEGVAACDRALADPRLAAKHWLRKASLLRARAIQNLADAKPDLALADLDLATGATRLPDDPFVKRSMVLGIAMVRGYAVAQKGDSVAGHKLVLDVQRQRPFDRALSLAIAAMVSDDQANDIGLGALHSLARLDPRMIDLIFQSAFERGDFQRAIEIYPHIRPMTRVGDIGLSRVESTVQDFKKELEEIRFRIARAGQLAYANAALGNGAGAKAALDDGRATLAAAIPAALPPLAAGEKEGSRKQLDRQLNGYLVKAGVAGVEQFATWSTLVDFRLQAPTIAGAELKTRFEQARVPRDGGLGVTLDLIKLVIAKNPSDLVLAKSLADFQAARAVPAMIDTDDAILLFNALPHTEIAERVPGFRKSNAVLGALWGGVNGFKTKPDKTDPARATISFASPKSSSSVVQEMALLRAADYTRERGHSAFVIDDRSDYERTISATAYGTVLRTDPDGYSSSLTIEMVDLDRLPDRYRTAPWRAIPAADVIAELGPVYITDTPDGARP